MPEVRLNANHPMHPVSVVMRDSNDELERTDSAPWPTSTSSGDGVDITLIRWMLTRSPAERLAALQSNLRSILWLRDAKPRT